MYIIESVCLFVRGKRQNYGRIDAKCSEIKKKYPESVLHRLKTFVLVFLGRYCDISGFPSRSIAIFTYLPSTSGLRWNQYTCCVGQSAHVSITLKHCHIVTSIAQLSVINIADIRSAFDKALTTQCFRRITVDCAP